MESTNTPIVPKEAIMAALAPIVDPDLGLSIIDLGLVYDVRVNDGRVEVDMTLTSMGCPAGEYLYDTVKQSIDDVAGVTESTVNLVWDPPWSVERVAPEVRFALNLY